MTIATSQLRFCVLLGLAALLAATSAPAAPVPKDRVPPPFGRPVPDETGATFEIDNEGVTLTMPKGTAHPHHPSPDGPGLRRPFPRTSRAVRGDFVATVRVRCDLPGGSSDS